MSTRQCRPLAGAASQRTMIAPFLGKEGRDGMSTAAHGRPKRRQPRTGAASRRTMIAPFLGKGDGGMA
jgi:hypothetical protein